MSIVRRLVVVRPHEGGVADVARQVVAELARRGRAPVELVVREDARLPAWSALGAAVAHRRTLRDAELIHVELGALGLATWWFALWCALLTAHAGARLVIVAHDAPRVVVAPSAGLLGSGQRWRDVVVHRVLVPLLDERLRRALVRRVSVGVVLSEAARREWGQRGPRHIVVTDHGADPPASDPVPPSDGSYVLCAGFIGPPKGVDVLIEAWSALGSVELPLVVAGTDDGDGYLDLLRERGRMAARPPEWRGWVAREELRRLIAAAAIVVLPYRRSNPASGILVRAMVEGRAIVATRVPAALDALGSDDALLVDPGDHLALAGALRRLLADPTLRNALGARAAAHAAARFTWQRHLAGLEVAYELALGDA